MYMYIIITAVAIVVPYVIILGDVFLELDWTTELVLTSSCGNPLAGLSVL